MDRWIYFPKLQWDRSPSWNILEQWSYPLPEGWGSPEVKTCGQHKASMAPMGAGTSFRDAHWLGVAFDDPEKDFQTWFKKII